MDDYQWDRFQSHRKCINRTSSSSACPQTRSKTPRIYTPTLHNHKLVLYTMKFNIASRIATTIFLLTALPNIVYGLDGESSAIPFCVGGTLLSLCCQTTTGPFPRGYVGSKLLLHFTHMTTASQAALLTSASLTSPRRMHRPTDVRLSHRHYPYMLSATGSGTWFPDNPRADNDIFDIL